MSSSFGNRRSRHEPQRDSSLGRLHRSLNKSNAPPLSGQPKASIGFFGSTSKENSSDANLITRKSHKSSPSTPFSLLKEEFEDDDDQSLLYSPNLPIKESMALKSSASGKAVRFREKNLIRHYDEPSDSGKKPSSKVGKPFVVNDKDDDAATLLPVGFPARPSPEDVQNSGTINALPSPAINASPLQAPSLSAIHPKHTETPFTINKKGVCTDLSGIFGAAIKQTTVKKPWPTAQPRQQVAVSAVKTCRTVYHDKKSTVKLNRTVNHERESLDESEESMFTNWLNQLLCPIDESTAETGAFHVLVLQQKLSKIRIKARQVLRSVDFDPLRGHILKGNLKLRQDNDVSANLGCRKQLIELLFSYSPQWLRLGLETVFSAVFTATDRNLMRKFIVSNVVQDNDILNKYTHGKCKVPSGSFEASYRDELRTVVLFRILSLVCFLDVAKREQVLERPLFHAKAKLKSTKKLLFQFCCDFMKGEGNIVKHLTRLGLEVLVEQSAKEELDFQITNIKVDLCDGIRLTRLAEILSGATLITKLRLPVVSRLQKFHNVKLALNNLKGIPDSILAHHIVDGHRPQVLRFLWSVVAYYCLPSLLSKDAVVAEIQRIRRIRQKEVAEYACDRLESALLEWSQLICSLYNFEVRNLDQSFSDGKAVCYLIHYYHPDFIHLNNVRNKQRVWKFAEEGMSLLGGIPVFIPDAKEEPVTLCLSFLCSRMIETRKQVVATQSIQCIFRLYQAKKLRKKKVAAASKILHCWRLYKHQYYKNQALRFAEPVRTIEHYLVKYWQNLKANLCKKKEQYGQNTIAANQIQSFARSALFRQRLESAILQRAAIRRIQTNFRGYQARKFYVLLRKRHEAANLIQCAFIQLLETQARRKEAAVVIQSYWRRFNEQMNLAVAFLDIIDIQRCLRGFLGRQRRDGLLHRVVRLQAIARQLLAITYVGRLRVNRNKRSAAMVIQAAFRREQAIAKVYTRRNQRRASILLQSQWRGRVARQALFELKATFEDKQAAIKIEKFARVFLSKKIFWRLYKQKTESNAATRVQVLWRAVLAKKLASQLRQEVTRQLSTIVIQSFCRMSLARFILEKLKRKHLRNVSAVVLQTQWRAHYGKYRFLTTLSAITKMQAIIRARSQRNLYWTILHFLERIQCNWRAAIARKTLAQSVRAAVSIQAFARRIISAACVQRKVFAVVKVQSVVRVFLSKNVLQRRKVAFALKCYAASIVQRYWRGHITCLKYRLFRSDLLVVQSCVRRYNALKELKKLQSFITMIQKYVRRLLAQVILWELKDRAQRLGILKFACALRIQAVVRGHATRTLMSYRSSQAVRVQSLVRGNLAKISYQTDRAGIVAVQCKARQWLSARMREHLKIAIGRLQCWARVCIARQVHSTLIEKRKRMLLNEASAQLIQCCVRRCQAQNLLRKEISACKIQKTWRCYTFHVSYMTFLVSALEIQTWTRRFFAMCAFDRRYESVLFLQAVARGFLQRREVETQRIAATTIQCMFRVFVARQQLDLRFIESNAASIIASFVGMLLTRIYFVRCRNAAQILQSRYRGFRERSTYHRMNYSVTLIQASFRRFVYYREFLGMKAAAIRIQTRARRRLAIEYTTQLIFEKMARLHRLKICAKKIQHAWLKWVGQQHAETAATKVQASFLRLVAQSRYKRLRQCALQLQALVRGRKARRCFSRRERVLSKKIASANSFARSHPECRLANRSRMALSKVLRCKSLTATMKAIWVLELSTRLSYDFCDSFSQSGAIDIMFKLMNECNRSLPHLKLQYGILLTLSNVLRHDQFVQFIISSRTAAMLISFLHLFQDNQCLFAQTLVLFGRLMRFVADPVVSFDAFINVFVSHRLNHRVELLWLGRR